MNRTYDHYEKGKGHEHNTWISTPGEGLSKRQCPVQISVTPDKQQSRLAIVFRGKGLRIRKDKHKAWHPASDVYFQVNAWVKEEFSRFVLYADNLTGQESDKFK